MIVVANINGKKEYPYVTIVHSTIGAVHIFGPNRDGQGGTSVFLTKAELEQAVERLRDLPENTIK